MSRFVLLGLSGLLVVTAGIVFIGKSAVTVRDRAAERAGREPYCIQVAAAGSDYRPALALSDLTKLTMWAEREGGMFMQRHAMLVVGSLTAPQRFYWSYRANNFVADENTNPNIREGIACEPAQDFAANLPVVSARAPPYDFVWFSPRKAYRIPKGYQTHWRGAGARGTLFVVAPAPDFQPDTKSVSSLRSSGQLVSQWIFLSHDPAWLLSLMKRPPPKNTRYIAEGEIFGLERTRTVFTGADAKQYVGNIYSTGTADVEKATYISCGPKSCQHRFLDNGRQFMFDHTPEHLQDWRQMQGKILDLFEAAASQR